jgi:WxL interacting protein linking bacterial and host surfaces
MNRSVSTRLALILAVAAAFASVGLVRAADEPPRFGLTPVGQDEAYFSLTMAPGETRNLEVELANFGQDEALARTYAADAYSIVNGGFGAELFGDAPSGTTLWLDYEGRELRLAPNKAIVIAFRVTVPDTAEPGDYLTSLVAENAEPYGGPAEGEIGFQQVNRSAIAVAIDVPGLRQPSIEIGSVSHQVVNDVSVVGFEIANTGNVHLKPSANFILRDAAGTEMAAAPLQMDTVYAGMTTKLEAPLAARLVPADYCAELAIVDAKTGASDESDCLSFTVAAPVPEPTAADGPPFQGIPVIQPAIEAAIENPLMAVVAIVGVLALVAAAAFLWVRRSRRNRAAVLDAPPAPPAPPAVEEEQPTKRSPSKKRSARPTAARRQRGGIPPPA